VHQGGGGGNEDRDFRMLDRWIAPLLAKVPALYLGDAPFKELADVAAKIEVLEDLPANIKAVEQVLADQDVGAKHDEAERIHDALLRYRDLRLERVKAAYESDPDTVVPALRELSAAFAGTKLGKPVADELDKVQHTKVLSHARAWHKAYAKVDTKLARLRPCAQASRARSGFDANCAECQKANKRAIKRIVAELDRLIKRYPDLDVLVKKARAQQRALTASGRPRH